jgi:hypothetical protein
VHTCFNSCSSFNATDFEDYQSDSRQDCYAATTDPALKDGLYCVHPDEDCEIIHYQDEICINGDKTCFSMTVIWIAIFIANFGQFVLEVALLFTLNITYKPTSLELILDPSKEVNVTNEDEDDISCEKLGFK